MRLEELLNQACQNSNGSNSSSTAVLERPEVAPPKVEVKLPAKPEPQPEVKPQPITKSDDFGYERPGKTKRISIDSYCVCCGEKIAKGTLTELLQVKGVKRSHWVHPSCAISLSEPRATSTSRAGVDSGAVRAIAQSEDQQVEIRMQSRLLKEISAGNAPIMGRIDGLLTKIEELAKMPPKVIEIRQGDRKVEIKGGTHPAFEQVLKLVGLRFNIFLPGPAGCGKSHLAHQVAEALSLRFGSISCTAGMSESQLTGRLVPRGEQGQFEFVTTEFLECYENGGVFLLDELDACDPNVLLIINQALANGRCPVPNRPGQPVAMRHADFICIAAANTYGRGADRQYVGRTQLDESSLDRFRMGTVPMDYDRHLEKQLLPNTVLLNKIWAVRDKVMANRLERCVSTRFIKDAALANAGGLSDEWIMGQLTQGWRDDEKRKVGL